MSVWTSFEPGLPPLASGWLDALSRRLRVMAFKARLVLALTGGLLASLIVLLLLLPAPRRVPVIPDPGIGAWTRSPGAASRLAILSPALAGLPRSGALWTRTRDGATETEDRLIVGDMDGPRAFMLAAAAGSSAADTSLFVASARLAANEGLSVSRFAAGQGPDQETRFAPMETARVSLSRVFPSGLTRDSCAAWRAPAGSNVVLIGFACPAAGETLTDSQLDCLLRDLVAQPGADSALREALRPAGTSAACRTPGPAKTARKG